MNERRNLQAEIQQKRQNQVKLQSQLYKDLGSYRRVQERQASIKCELNRNSTRRVKPNIPRNIPTIER